MKKYLVFAKEKYSDKFGEPKEFDSLDEIFNSEEYDKGWIITKPVKIKIVEDEKLENTPCQPQN